MEFYYETGIDDLVVPKDEELSDRLPSPRSWSKWGVRAPWGFNLPTQSKCVAAANNMIDDEADFRDGFLSNDAEMESSTYQKSQSGGSRARGGASEESLCGSAPSTDQSYDQHDCLAGIGQMDDLYLNSLLEGLPGNQNTPGSFCFSSSLQGGTVPADDLFTDTDSQVGLSDAHSERSVRYFKRHAFSPSNSWDKGVDPASRLSGHNSVQKDSSEGKVENIFFLDQGNADGHPDEISLEESVLEELRTVIAQLSHETRICFRDALYRLAQNSRQQVVGQDQDGELSVTTSTASSSGGKRMMELETNSIDRAVANLMFNNKMDTNVRDFPASATASSVLELADPSAALNYGICNRAQAHGVPHFALLPGDAEVPIFGQIKARQCTST